jgi:hypothetical protein
MDHDFMRRDCNDRGVIGVLKTNEDIVALGWLESGQDTTQHRGPDFGSTAPTAHGERRNFLQGLGVCQTLGQGW